MRAIYMNQQRGIHLNQSKYRWDRTESPASYALRYICSLRRFLIAGLACENATDQILENLIQSLVSNGYEEKTPGRFRDYLISRIKQQTEDHLSNQDLTTGSAKINEWINEALQPQSLLWMRTWRDSLLERSWRSLEKSEHVDPEMPVHSVLHASSTQPNNNLAMISVQVATSQGVKIPEERVGEILAEAKIQFAQILADEICETLSVDSLDSIQEEIQLLGLSRAFDGIRVFPKSTN